MPKAFRTASRPFRSALLLNSWPFPGRTIARRRHDTTARDRRCVHPFNSFFEISARVGGCLMRGGMAADALCGRALRLRMSPTPSDHRRKHAIGVLTQGVRLPKLPELRNMPIISFLACELLWVMPSLLGLPVPDHDRPPGWGGVTRSCNRDLDPFAAPQAIFALRPTSAQAWPSRSMQSPPSPTPPSPPHAGHQSDHRRGT